MTDILRGERFVLQIGELGYPELLRDSPNPPEKLYGIGDPSALLPGLAIVGPRRATPYGRSVTKKLAALAAERDIPIISGGARGCDAVAHEAALIANARTVVVLGGGCDRLYPEENIGLFQRIVNAGGAVVSEHPWNTAPKPYSFLARNRIIATLARAVLVTEAGLPSGTFSTADAALNAGREVWAVPGAITSDASRGTNRLIYQGALPIVDDDSFTDALFTTFGL